MNAIEARNLKKSFADLQAVADADFAVAPGEILSLLGPNGAGKSTTISILAGLLQADSGQAFVMGHSVSAQPQAAKACLGVVPQEIALYPDLTARENLLFWGRMYGLRGAALKQRVDETLEVIGLSGRQRDQVGKYSGGMKRRVNLGAALLHQPPVVIMDEPTVGIDPQSRRHILDNVLELNRQGLSVLYTTHYMEEAAELSHRIAIMDQGRIIACGTHDELIKLVNGQTRITLTLNAAGVTVLEDWQAVEGVNGISANEAVVNVLATDSNLVLPRLFEAAAARGARITSVDIQEPNLEAVFLHLTGRALRD